MATKKRRSSTHELADVISKIIPARDATPITSLLLYARNKVGKTNLCASAAEIAETLIIDCERGTSSIKKSKAKVYKLTTFEEIDEIYWYLSTQKHPYKFVCIDPISRLGQLAMEFVLREKASIDLAADPHTPDQRDWGKTAELMRNIITKYKDLPNIFLIITAYERRRNNDDQEAEIDYLIGPDAQPAIKGFLMGQMDIIARLYIKQLEGANGRAVIERRLLTEPHEAYEAGDRSGNLPRVMRQPTMAFIGNALTLLFLAVKYGQQSSGSSSTVTASVTTAPAEPPLGKGK